MSLTELMQAATADVTPRIGLVADARQRARRRLRLRRLRTVGAAVLSVVLLGGLGLTLHHGRSPVAPYAGTLSDGRTHGDLAGDADYLRQVAAAWDSGMKGEGAIYQHPVGAAKVVWAGATAAGPAAIVLQTLDVPRRYQNTRAGRYLALGYLGVGPSGPRVVGTHFGEQGKTRTAFYVDPEHRVLLVVDRGVAQGVSFSWTYSADGSARRHFVPLAFRDGVASVTLPHGVSRYTTQVSDLPSRTFHDLTTITNVELPGEALRTGLQWPAPDSGPVGLPLGTVDDPALGTTSSLLLAQTALQARTDIPVETFDLGNWVVYGTDAKGQVLRVVQRQLDDDPARLYLLMDGHVTDEGPVQATRALPIALHLPDGQGWLVARYGATLRYRLTGQAWQPAHAGAALLPDAATDVELSGPGISTTVVSLQHR